MITLNLRQILHERNIEQKDFAETTGISRTSINRMCNNKAASVKLEHIHLIMQALDLTDFNDLFKFK